MIALSLTLEFRDLSLQGGLPVSLLVVANYASTKLPSTYMDDLRIKLDPTHEKEVRRAIDRGPHDESQGQ
jgi:hypothetical protein